MILVFEILKEAAENVREFHRNQKNGGFTLKKSDGIIIVSKSEMPFLIPLVAVSG